MAVLVQSRASWSGMLVKSDLTLKDISLWSFGICTVLITSMKLSVDCSLCWDLSVKGFWIFTWLWRWLPHRLSKRQSLTTVLLWTPITQMIFFNQGMLLLGSNHFLISRVVPLASSNLHKKELNNYEKRMFLVLCPLIYLIESHTQELASYRIHALINWNLDHPHPGQGGGMRGIFMVLEGMVRAWRWGFLRIYIHRSGGARWGFDLCLVSSR